MRAVETVPVEPSPESGLYDIYTESNYYGELADRIAGTTAGDRVAVTTMGMDPSEPKVALVLDEMARAAQRKVDVSLGVDAFAFMIGGKSTTLGPLFTRGHLEGRLSPVFRERLDVVRWIGSYATGHAAITNVPERRFTNPAAGRSHIKGGVVNDWYSVGGCNLIYSDKLDMMVGAEDQPTSDFVYGLMSSIIAANSVRKALGDKDFAHRIDDDTELAVDVGVPGQSLILNKSLDLLSEADQWALLSCQYFPNGATGQVLADLLKQGVDARAIYNNPSKHGLIESTWQKLSILAAGTHLPPDLFEGELPLDTQTIHDKALATNNGGAVGTHNYIQTGVRLGTAEMTLFRRTPEFGVRVGRTLLTQAVRQLPQSNLDLVG